MGIGFDFSTPLLNNLTVKYSFVHNKGRNSGLYSKAIFWGQFMSAFIAGTENNVLFIITSIIGFIIAVIILNSIRLKRKRQET